MIKWNDLIKYRLADNTHVSQLVEIARTFHEASGLSKYGAVFNDSHVHDMLCNMIVNQDSLVLIATDERTVYGAIGAHLSHHIMNRDQGLVLEIFQWVRSEARGNGIGGRLLTGVEVWARDKGAVTMAMMSMYEMYSPAGLQFLNKGYVPTEQVWMKRL